MAVVAPLHQPEQTTYHGLRMSCEEYRGLAADGCDYELIDGIVIMSPGPTPRHQNVTGVIYRQLAEFLDVHQVGMVFIEIDVDFGNGPIGRGLVYRPELVFVRRDHLKQFTDSVNTVPDMVLEVISPASRRLDTETKKHDYERFGVLEYWLIDPANEAMLFFRLEAGRYVDVAPMGDQFASHAVPGFRLDLAKVRKSFQAC